MVIRHKFYRKSCIKYIIEDYIEEQLIYMENKAQYPSTQYKFTQVFGSNESPEVEDEDVISCLKYDQTGKFLCLGDNAGRVIIFQNNKNSKSLKVQDQIYDYYAQFQSHVRQFDPLKGNQSSEEIVDISWLRPQGKFLKLLTTNTKSIKVWKAFQKIDKKILKGANKQLHLPKLQSQEPSFTANQQYIFPSVHSCPINSISNSKNQQYLLSTDEQKSFIWSLQKPGKPYVALSIADKRKAASSQLSITCSKMHPTSDTIFVYGMNRCQLGLCDVRISSSCSKVMDLGQQARSMKNFFTDMVASVGSTQFTKNGKYIISRQYLNVKVWDLTNTKKPLLNICIQDSLKSKLVSLFQNENIYDKFNIASSQDSSTIITGNYNNYFHLINLQNGMNTQYQLSFQKNTINRSILPGKSPPISKMDTRRKTSVLAYHPENHSVAVASLNCFFIYTL